MRILQEMLYFLQPLAPKLYVAKYWKCLLVFCIYKRWIIHVHGLSFFSRLAKKHIFQKIPEILTETRRCDSIFRRSIFSPFSSRTMLSFL